MRNGCRFIVLSITILLAFLSAPGPSAALAEEHARNVIAAVPRSWPPQYQTDENGNPSGFAIDVMEEVARRAGLTVTYLVKDSFADVVAALKNGEADLIPNSGIIKERLADFDFTAPVETFTISLFVREDTNDLNGADDLPGRRLAVVETNIGQIMFQNRKDIDVRLYRDVRTALFELAAGRVDALVYPRPVIEKLIRTAGIEHRFKTVGKPLKEIRRGIRFLKGNDELLGLVNEAVEEFVATPAYHRVYVKWFGTPNPFWTTERIIWALSGLFAVLAVFVLWTETLRRKVASTTRALRLSEVKYRSIIDATTAVVWTTDPEGKFSAPQKSWQHYTGQRWPEHQGFGWTKMIHPDDADNIRKTWTQALETGSTYRSEGRVWNAAVNGYRHFIAWATPLFNDDGSIREWFGTITDITPRKQAEEDLRRAHDELEMRVEERTIDLRKLSRAIDQSPNAVFITDTDGNIEYVNPSFTSLTGFTQTDSIGENPRILKSGKTPSEIYAEMWKTIQSGHEWRSEIKDLRKDGSHFWAHETIAPVKDDAGTITHYVATHEDITERKEAELTIQTALEEAGIANRAKSELMANMSHELRTPLKAIIGFSDSIKQEIFGPMGNDKYREYIDDIFGSGQHLLELINDILDVSAIEAGRLDIDEEDFAIAPVVESSLKLIKQRAEEGGVKLTTTIDIDLPPIRADKRRIKQIILNLLSNAVKFTPPDGTVELGISLNGSGGYILSVRDTGIGMSDAEVKKALLPFAQVGRDKAKKQEGTGLGLPLTKGLVELHDGQISIASKEGGGTTVTVRLPESRVVNFA